MRTDGAEVGFTSGSPRPPAHDRAEVTECVGRGSKPPRAPPLPVASLTVQEMSLRGQPGATRYRRYWPVPPGKTIRTVDLAGQFGRARSRDLL